MFVIDQVQKWDLHHPLMSGAPNLQLGLGINPQSHIYQELRLLMKKASEYGQRPGVFWRRRGSRIYLLNLWFEATLQSLLADVKDMSLDKIWEAKTKRADITFKFSEHTRTENTHVRRTRTYGEHARTENTHVRRSRTYEEHARMKNTHGQDMGG